MQQRCIIVATFDDHSADQSISTAALGVDLLAGRQLFTQPAHMGANRPLVSVISFTSDGTKDFAIGKPLASRRGENPIDVGLGFRHLARRRARRKSLARTARLVATVAPNEMTKTEADIYRLLSSARGKWFSYREIFDSIRGEGYYGDEGSIRSHVSRLREKLPSGEQIDSKRGRGYALIG